MNALNIHVVASGQWLTIASRYGTESFIKFFHLFDAECRDKQTLKMFFETMFVRRYHTTNLCIYHQHEYIFRKQTQINSSMFTIRQCWKLKFQTYEERDRIVLSVRCDIFFYFDFFSALYSNDMRRIINVVVCSIQQ